MKSFTASSIVIWISVAVVLTTSCHAEQVASIAQDADKVATMNAANKANGSETVRNPSVLKGLDLRADGATVIVEPGKCKVGDAVVCIAKPVTLKIEPISEVAESASRHYRNVGQSQSSPYARDTSVWRAKRAACYHSHDGYTCH